MLAKQLIPFLLFANLAASTQQINYRVRRISVDEGLSHSDATAIVQDKKGFIWIGTFSGLDRFDGFEIKHYRNQNQKLQSVYHNRINAIAADSGNGLWLGTEQGIVRFNTATETFTTFRIRYRQPQGCNENFNRLLWLSNNQIVALSNNFTLVSAFVQTGTDELTEQPLPAVPAKTGLLFSDLVAGEKGGVWLSSDNGLWLLQTVPSGRLRFVLHTYLRAAQKTISDISSLVNLGGGRWAAGTKGGFCTFEEPQDSFSRNASPLAALPCQYNDLRMAVNQKGLNLPDENLEVVSLAPGINGDGFWLATGAGIFHYQLPKEPGLNAPGLQLIKTGADNNYSLSSDFLNRLFVDVSGGLWALSYGGGVNLINLRQKKFYLLTGEPGAGGVALSGSHIRAILEDDDGSLWIGTRFQGLNHYDFRKARNTVYRHVPGQSNSLMSDNIRALAKDKQGRIWVGNDFGIDVFSGGRFSHIEAAKLSGGKIFSMAVDVFGQVWAGSWERGLNRIRQTADGKRTIEKLYAGDGGIGGEQVTFVYADPLRPEVFAATNNGLDRIFLDVGGNVQKIIHYRGEEASGHTLSSNFVWPVIRTDANTVWAGTLGGGLNKLTLEGSGYKATTYGVADGLPFADVETLLEDNNGNLWLGGGKGLVMFDVQKKKFLQYDVNDGLQSNSFKIGAACKGKDGKLFFGGVNGVNYFYPAEIVKTAERRPLVFTDLLVANEAVPAGSPLLPEGSINDCPVLELGYNQNYFSIRFALLDFGNPGKYRYRYRLQGFGNNWIESVPGQRSASFAGLPSGRYEFLLQASGEDGLWDETATRRLPVIIAAPWWRRPAAQMAFAALALLVLAGIFWYTHRMVRLKKALHLKSLEEKQAEEHHQMRLQFFTNISHELRTPLSLILTPAEKLLADAEEKDGRRSLYTLIHKNAGRLLKLVNELMDFRKAEDGSMKLAAHEASLSGFLQSIVDDFGETAAQNDVQLLYEADITETTAWFDPSVVEKIFVNLIANAFQHTPPGGAISVKLLGGGVPQSVLANKLAVGIVDDEQCLHWVKVADNGAGIDAQSLARIFDRYFQALGHEKTDKHSGTGIGLALVKSLTLAHRGAIRVFSQRNRGTEFFIGLPKGHDFLGESEMTLHPDFEIGDEAIRPLHKSGAESNDGPSKAGRARVLIVEDNKELCRFLADSLGETYSVTTAADGEEGWQQALHHQPDIVISDIVMPGVDGLELCRRLRSSIETSHIPLVLLSAKNSVDSHITGAESGADLYLDKPFSLRLLKTSIENLLETRRKLKELFAHNGLLEAREMVSRQKDKAFLDAFIKMVEENMDKPEFDVDEVSRGLAISRSKLYTKMHQVTGMTIGDFVRKIKLRRAAVLLVTESRTVQEVFLQVGFQSASHFTKAFKKEFGKTPSQYVQDFGAAKA